MHIALKDPGTAAAPSTPTEVNAITITRYHVEYIRADGRNTPGVDVPYGFDGAVTVTVSATTTFGFQLVRVVAKEESPLVQLKNQQVRHHRDRARDLLRPRSGRQRGDGDRFDSSGFRQLRGFLGMKGLLSSAILVAAVALAGCTVHQTEAPGLAGPSDLALSIRVTALPDSISQDGGSQSSIQVTAIGPDGKPTDRACRYAWTCS